TAERAELAQLSRRGTAQVRVFKRARVLQLMDQGWAVRQIPAATGLSRATVQRVRHRYEQGGLDQALYDRARPGAARRLTPGQTAQIVAMVCGPPPPGRARWTVRLVTSEALRRHLVVQVSRETIRKLLAAHELKPWRHKRWCVSELTEEFITRMEDVLDLYERP